MWCCVTRTNKLPTPEHRHRVGVCERTTRTRVNKRTRSHSGPALGKGTVRYPATQRTNLILRIGAKAARNTDASSYKTGASLPRLASRSDEPLCTGGYEGAALEMGRT